MAKTQPEKKQLLLDMLEQGLTMLHLDARPPEVKVPTYLKDDYQLRLNLSYRFRDIDLVIDDTTVSAVLSFQGTPFPCVIPLQAIWGLSQPHAEDFKVFPEDLPAEIQLQLSLALHALKEDDDDTTPPPVRRPLAAVPPLEPSAQRGADPGAKEDTSRDTKRPALRLVVDNTQDPDDEEPPSPEETPDTSSRQHADKRSKFRVISTPPDDPKSKE